jgi:hypothetical protein
MEFRLESGEFTLAWAQSYRHNEAGALAFVRQFRNDAMAIASLRRLLAERGLLDADVSRDEDRLLARIAQLLANGQLVAGYDHVVAKNAQQEELEDRPVKLKSAAGNEAPRAVKTWVEFQVVDMEDNPVSGKRYKCMLPDGRMEEGLTDAKGTVRFNDIDPGNCVFSLDMDQEAWEKVG